MMKQATGTGSTLWIVGGSFIIALVLIMVTVISCSSPQDWSCPAVGLGLAIWIGFMVVGGIAALASLIPP